MLGWDRSLYAIYMYYVYYNDGMHGTPVSYNVDVLNPEVIVIVMYCVT